MDVAGLGAGGRRRGPGWAFAAGTCLVATSLLLLTFPLTEPPLPHSRTAPPAQPNRASGTSEPGLAYGRAGARARSGPHGTVTLAFAGDMHFQLQLAALLDHPRGALGPITRTLASADLAMVNLESAIGTGGSPDPKEREDPQDRFWFHTPPKALDVLAAAGVDVATVANNHGADYGAAGFAETLRARRHAPVALVGLGRNRREAFTPYRNTIRGTDIAVLAADASFREGMAPTWAAGPRTPGLAAAHSSHPRALLRAVRAADRTADVVVVYLHWGTEHRSCPDTRQQTLARSLARAGADLVLGSHAHVLLGAGWLGEAYVDYGLGNFLWYHDREPVTGVLRVTVRDGEVAGGRLVPARIQSDGRPLPLQGSARRGALEAWRRLRSCTGLAAHRSVGATRPPYTWSSRPIGPALASRVRSSYHAGCPVRLSDLRYLRLPYVGFDRRVHRGRLVVRERYASDVAGVFRKLYDAGWPIRRMRLVDVYGGDDDRSMAADNTSGFNCRQVAGSTSWSEHASGAAIDLDPVENPDLTEDVVAPPAGRRYVSVNRSPGADPAPGVITADSLPVRAFAAIGWTWGGTWTSGPDYQHFFAPDRPRGGRAAMSR